MKMSKKTMLCLMSVVLCMLSVIAFAVGTTRITGVAGPAIDLKTYLAGNLAEAQVPIVVANTSWSYGTGANQFNVAYADTITLADANSSTLDLYASGTLYDVYHRALTMSALKLLYLRNNSTDATLLAFGGSATDIAVCSEPNDIIEIPPGGSFVYDNPSGSGLTLTTNKNLKLAHNGTGSTAMTIDVIALGND